MNHPAQILNLIMTGQKNWLLILSKGYRAFGPTFHLMYDNLPIVKNNIASLNQFQTINISALGKSLYQMKSSICVLDIVPTKFLKKGFPTVGPIMLPIIYSCLISGKFQNCLKHAVIQPILKKTKSGSLITQLF